MLLVLAPEQDEAAERFARAARSQGIAAVRATMDAVAIHVALDRAGRIRVALTVGRKPVRGILNRGFAIDPAAQFDDSERLAAWWSALACFAGPVVNRPSRAGFLPELDVLSLAAHVPGLALAPMCIGTAAAPELTGRTVNVHSARDGSFLGRDDGAHEEELRVFTAFDAERTFRILVVGDRCFTIGESHTAPDVIAALTGELRRRGATFGLAVLQPSSSAATVELIYTTALPRTSHYAGLEEDVHDALLEYLAS